MLIESGAEKILVCAPSNAAIDEVVMRIHTRGLLGSKLEEAKVQEMLLRIGSMDYEPSPQVKPHTFDQRLIESLNFQMMFDNKTKLSHVDTLLGIVKQK
jgi:hypothetical protein